MAVKKLADFEGHDAVRVTGKILAEITRLQDKFKAAYPDAEQLEKDMQEDKGKFFEMLMDVAPEQLINILAILNDVPREDYHFNGATFSADFLAAFSDEDFIKLFKMQA